MTHYNLGTALARKGQLDEAIRQFREALRLKSDYAEVHSNLGTALGRNGQQDEAIKQFQEALRIKPDDADGHYNLGTALARKVNWTRPSANSRKLSALNPITPKPTTNLA